MTKENTLGKLIISAITACILGALGYSYADNRKREQYMLSLPPEYFTAEAEKAKANSELAARKYEAQKAEAVAKHQAKLDFEKNAGPEYWAYKNAKEERETQERIAKGVNDTKRAQAAELRRAFESYTK